MLSRALHAAAHYGYSDCLEVLLELGGSVNLRGAGDNSPLHCAVLSGEWAPACVQVLTLNDASVNAVNKKGDSPLHLAASLGDVAVVELLLQHGAEQRANIDGNSPVDLAEISGHSKCLDILKGKLPATSAAPQKPQTGFNDNSSMMKELQQLRLQNAGYRNKCQDLDDANAKLKQEMAASKAEVLALRTTASEVEGKVDELRASRDTQASEAEALRVQCEEYRSALAQYHKEQVEAEKKLADNAAIINSLRDQEHEHKQQRATLGNELQQTKEELERLHVVLSNLEAKAKMSAQLQAALDRNEATLQERTSELREVHEQYQRQQALSEKARQDLTAAQTENQVLRQDLSKLENDNRGLMDQQLVTDKASRQLLSMLQTEKRQLCLLKQNAQHLRINMETSLSKVNEF